MSVASRPSTATASAPRQGSLKRSRPRYGEGAIRFLLFLAALVSVATTIGIVVALARPAISFFREVGVVEFLTGTEWAPLFANPSFGVLPLVSATLLITAIALVVAMPLGLGAAIYLSEYAQPRTRKFVKPLLEVLAGIPTIVYGFFALSAITPALEWLLPGSNKIDVFNALSAGIAMGIMILPTIASLSEDAMKAVPGALREGAYALGSSKMQVAQRVVVPAALSGIVAAFVLGISRAIGETMIVTVAAGLTPNFSLNPLEAMQTMTAFIAAAGMGDQPQGTIGYKAIFAVGSLLFLITFVMNAVSIRLVRKYSQRYE